MPGWNKVICSAIYGSVGVNYRGACITLPRGKPNAFRVGGNFSDDQEVRYVPVPRPGEQLVLEIEVDWDWRKLRILRWGYRYCYDQSSGIAEDLVNFDLLIPAGFRIDRSQAVSEHREI